MDGCQNYGPLAGSPKYSVPYYTKEPKRGDDNVDNPPCTMWRSAPSKHHDTDPAAYNPTAQLCLLLEPKPLGGSKKGGLGSRFFLGIFWFYVRGCCKNCKSHKDETNAEAAIGLFLGIFLGFAVMGHADRAIDFSCDPITSCALGF